jgi:hypothetical protein
MTGIYIAIGVIAFVYSVFFLLFLAALIKFADKEPFRWKFLASLLWPLAALSIANVGWADSCLNWLHERCANGR